MSVNQEEIGARIKSLRMARGITRERMAEDLCLSFDYLKKIESGKRMVTIELCVVLEAYFDVSIDYLICGRDYVNSKTKETLVTVISALSKLCD